MTPAIVVIRTPEDKGSIRDVRLPLWCPAYSREDAARMVKSDLYGEYLTEAELAHEAGNPAALVVAVRLLRARPDLPWPAWLSAGVLQIIEDGGIAPAAANGRHAPAWKRWRADAADYLRYRAIEILARGASVAPLGPVVLEQLKAEAGEHAAQLEADSLRKAYDRVIERCGAPETTKPGGMHLHYHPRYYPDVVTLHVLHAADLLASE